jgi:hypothetical protein
VTNAAPETDETGASDQQLWIASALVCLGVAVTGISYLLTDDGKQYTLLWGPMLVGALIYGRAIVNGLSEPGEFTRRAVFGSVAAPIVLAAVFYGVAMAAQPTDADRLEAGMLPINRSEVHRLVREFETAPAAASQCDAAAKLGDMTGNDATVAVQALMRYYGVMPRDVQACMRNVVSKLDPSMTFPEPNRF